MASVHLNNFYCTVAIVPRDLSPIAYTPVVNDVVIRLQTNINALSRELSGPQPLCWVARTAKLGYRNPSTKILNLSIPGDGHSLYVYWQLSHELGIYAQSQ